ncbi:MAG: RnfABCDGE type electron transport complex subunit D, partial [Alistipes sp.]|nr:RnfABCDGE type electron transport complex subunit D [Alistipes sp.]
IIIVKMLFGGIGRNFVNPALAGRAFMFSWPVESYRRGSARGADPP